MPLLARMVASPLTVDVRDGAIEALPALLADSRISPEGQIAVAVGPGQGERVVASLGPALAKAGIHRIDAGTVTAARELADDLRQGHYDAVVAIGGGRTLDVAKYAASLVGMPNVAVATSLAHDGIASPVASLEHDGHKASYGVQMPLAVLADLGYVRRCPRALLAAGLGDALSNLNAVADWELSGAQTGEPVDGLAVAIARSAAESLLHRPDELVTDDFLTTLAHALVLGGLAMAVAGSSRPCSGSCHAIAHALNVVAPGDRFHGAEVAVGALFSSWLRDDPNVEALDACLRRHGVPRLPADLGVTDEQFAAAVEQAPVMRADRYTVLSQLQLSGDDVRARVREYVRAFDR
ncbi:MAG TPA: iron-containing alcohol dehydrogenase family protein [Baekduia sp.]|nr:iron-containing alcohol dehydrogenase family protein [Baekduia sp.]